MDRERVKTAVEARLAYDFAIENRYMEVDPVDVVGVAARKWLASEDALTTEEYFQYQKDYQGRKEAGA